MIGLPETLKYTETTISCSNTDPTYDTQAIIPKWITNPQTSLLFLAIPCASQLFLHNTDPKAFISFDCLILLSSLSYPPSPLLQFCISADSPIYSALYATPTPHPHPPSLSLSLFLSVFQLSTCSLFFCGSRSLGQQR